MRSLRARVAVAAVVATALAFVLSIAVFIGTFVVEFRSQAGHDPAGAAAGQQPPTADEPAGEPWQPFWDEQTGGAGPPAFIRRLARRLVLVNLGVLTVVGAVGLVLGGLALRPLAALQTAAERVASTRDLATRLPEGEGPEEVDALAGSLNAMLERLQRSTGQ
ncbi:MAG TPA: HAMP domain-containing protein, partial [Euzebyales bacterium]|nr:HAMP domain-containing protein [Euzebyales bacterium]